MDVLIVAKPSRGQALPNKSTVLIPFSGYFKEHIMTMRDRIEAKLTAAFAPSSLTVTDDSHHHAGHGGAREGGETHFSVDIASLAFAGKSRVDMHRAINAVLAEEFAERVHALAISARAG
jgi:BolA protein